ncbi:MAG: ribonuclease HII [Hyphomicrobiales bacterium]|nr:ribonuclease HII [Hyphomicrobiales bacterium]
MARQPASSSAKPMQAPDFRIESDLIARGHRAIAGIDEAGRGPLAGPVVAAAVILDAKAIPAGLNDSKKLTPRRRALLFDEIVAGATVAVAIASPDRIDAMNILGATMWAMAAAARGLCRAPDYLVIDGNRLPTDLGCPAEALIKGDGRSLSVAAASIVAKVVRDRIMVRLGAAYPGYGFERHMGYGSAEHLDALARLGPTPHHRRSFSPVRAALESAR